MTIARAHELVSLAEYAQAQSLLLRHLRLSPKDPDALHLMCFVLAHSGHMEKSLYYAERAAAASPTNPNTQANLGTTLLNLNRQSEALEALRRAVALEDPVRSVTAHHAFAFALNSARCYVECRQFCEAVLAAIPGNIPLSLDLAEALQNLALADQAVALLGPLSSQMPHDPLLAGNLAAAMNYVPGLSPEAVFHAHARFATALSRNLPAPSPPSMMDPSPDRAIRLGLIVPDLSRQSVSFFIRPLLERIDPDRFTLFIYYTSPLNDVEPSWPIADHTSRCIAWEPLPKLNGLVRADRLDMLMDLCGMSAQHRLQLMHLKPAPIQLTYAGYPNTTGLRSIDHRVVDAHTDPPGSEGLAVEGLLRLDPCFLCYTPPPDAPPALDGAPVQRPLTFGSFNHLPKLNGPLIHTWVRILAALPGSRLVLKAPGLHEPRTRAELQSRFVTAGLAEDRLSVLPPTTTRAEHLDSYSRIDIALDSFPYHGTTTTCEALLMGTPVVTLAGESHVSRVGISLLHAVGLGEFIARTGDEYIRIATTLARDPAHRNTLRAELRRMLVVSPLGDQAAFAGRIQALLRDTWRRRCSTLTQ